MGHVTDRPMINMHTEFQKLLKQFLVSGKVQTQANSVWAIVSSAQSIANETSLNQMADSVVDD